MTAFIVICAAMVSVGLVIIIHPLIKGAKHNSQQLTIAVLAVGLPLTASLLYLKIGDIGAINASPAREGPGGPPASVMQVIERAGAEPDNFEAQTKAADLYYQIQRYDEAIAYLKKANRLRPDDVETIILLGLANTEAGNLEAALTWLRAGLEYKPNNVVALEAYCLVLIHQGETSQADQALDHLTQLDPNNPDLPQIRTALKQAARN